METVWEMSAMPWLTARIDSNFVLHVYVSVAVRKGDPVTAPISDLGPYTMLDEQYYEDEGMMFGRAVSRQYQLAERKAYAGTPERFST